MRGKQKLTGTASTIPGGIALGLLVSLVVTLAGAALAAYLISNETIGENAAGYCSMGTLLLASAAGALVSVSRIKRLRLQMCLLSGAVYYLALLAMTALLFGGQYEGMGVTALMVFAGCGATALMGLKPKQGTRIAGLKKAYR